MTLRTDYANETDSTDAHPGAHNETNVKVNELDTRVAAIDPGTGFDARLAAIEARFAAVDLAVGVPTLDRANIAQNNALASGRFTFGCFVPPVNMTCAKIRTYSGTTAAAATPTIVQLAIYREEPSQAVTALGQSLCNYTLLGQTANTPTLYATVNTAYEPALQTPVPLIGGQRYALGIAMVSAAAMPNVPGSLSTPSALLEKARPPRRAGHYRSVTTPPATMTGNLIWDNQIPYLVALP